jgi:hypothetical protein
MPEYQNTENANEYNGWIEEAIKKEFLPYYDYEQFDNIKQIGTGGFGTVFRVNLKNSEQQLALKSFKLDNASIKEVIHEVISL